VRRQFPAFGSRAEPLERVFIKKRAREKEAYREEKKKRD
jgi:hypothetical protein